MESYRDFLTSTSGSSSPQLPRSINFQSYAWKKRAYYCQREYLLDREIRSDDCRAGTETGKVGWRPRHEDAAEYVAYIAPRNIPETGGIACNPYWQKLKRLAGCNKDDQLIASDFRRFCRDRGIALEAKNIEKMFRGYCHKVRQVEPAS